MVSKGVCISAPATGISCKAVGEGDETAQNTTNLEDPWNLVRLSIGSLAGEGWRVKKALSSPKNVYRLRPRPPGESWWEASQRAQNFDQFKRNMTARPSTTNGIIDIVVLGGLKEFADTVSLNEVLVIVEVFLCMKVILRREPLPLGPWAQVRESTDGLNQIAAHYALANMDGAADPRSLCTIGLTSSDMYPPRKFDYITGMTDPLHRLGLFSSARFFNGLCFSLSEDHKGETDPKDHKGETDPKKRASICISKVICREILKLYGFQECTLLHCLMNMIPAGETVHSLPFELCFICLRKLQFLTQADLLERFARLQSLLRDWFPDEYERMWLVIRRVGVLAVTAGLQISRAKKAYDPRADVAQQELVRELNA